MQKAKVMYVVLNVIRVEFIVLKKKEGMIDISSVSPNWLNFIDLECEELQRNFFEKPLDDLLVDLISIFRKGNPNYFNLSSLFGSEKKMIEEEDKPNTKGNLIDLDD